MAVLLVRLPGIALRHANSNRLSPSTGIVRTLKSRKTQLTYSGRQKSSPSADVLSPTVGPMAAAGLRNAYGTAEITLRASPFHAAQCYRYHGGAEPDQDYDTCQIVFSPVSMARWRDPIGLDHIGRMGWLPAGTLTMRQQQHFRGDFDLENLVAIRDPKDFRQAGCIVGNDQEGAIVTMQCHGCVLAVAFEYLAFGV